jgi:hypothetical protein
MTIVTLNWSGGIAFGPRGCRYEIIQEGGLFNGRVYTSEEPGGAQLTANAVTQEAAMLAAQRHAEVLTERFGAEAHAINSASDRKRVTIG